VEDAVEACQVVRRSIAELCHADHQDDPIVLEKWRTTVIGLELVSTTGVLSQAMKVA
jgi:hypothetical protein